MAVPYLAAFCISSQTVIPQQSDKFRESQTERGLTSPVRRKHGQPILGDIWSLAILVFDEWAELNSGWTRYELPNVWNESLLQLAGVVLLISSKGHLADLASRALPLAVTVAIFLSVIRERLPDSDSSNWTERQSHPQQKVRSRPLRWRVVQCDTIVVFHFIPI